MFWFHESGRTRPISPGTINSEATTTAIAPAVLRISAPMAMPNNPIPARYRPDPITARSTPSAASVVPLSPPRMAWPSRNAARHAATITTASVSVNTTAFPHSTGSRRGTAPNQFLIEPLAYSLLTRSTPSTPTINWARVTPAMLSAVGSVEANGFRPEAAPPAPGGEGAVNEPDATALSMAGVTLAQLIVGVLGVLLVSNEYANGSIRNWFGAVPRRLPVLWGKVIVLAGSLAVVMVLATLAAFLVGQAILGDAKSTPLAADPSSVSAGLTLVKA